LIKIVIFRINSYIYNLLYNRLSWAYDYVAMVVSFGSWNKWIFSLIPYVKGPNVLEIGFGPGHLLSKISQNDYKSIGLDASWYMCRKAYKNVSGNKKQLGLCQGFAENLPFSDSLFDQILITFPGNYIFDTMSLLEIARVLKIGGELFIIPYAWLAGNKWYHRIMEWYFPAPGDFKCLIIETIRRFKNDLFDWESFLHIDKYTNVIILHGRKLS